MKIRDKLLFAFSFYVLFTVFFGFLSIKELSSIRFKLFIIETADDITNNLLEIRRYEKNFLLYKQDSDYMTVKKYLEILKNNIHAFRLEVIEHIGVDSYQKMKEDIKEYEIIFEKVYENLKKQTDLITEIRSRGREIEQILMGDDLKTFFVLRRYEKNLILYKDYASYSTFARMCSVKELNMYTEVKRYCDMGKSLYELFRVEQNDEIKMRLKAREIESFTDAFSKKERASIEASIKKAINFLLYALLIILLIGAAVNIKLAKGISVPLKRLEEITKRIAAGDFSHSLKINGKDEITSLAVSFETMQERLKDTLNSLEQAIKLLYEKQQQLVESEKLASIGILAAGIAHEINNPLTSVLTFSNLMLEQTPEDDPRYERLKMMVRETERVRNIVRQLLNFAREMGHNPVLMNVNQPVSEIIESLIAQDAFKDIELKVNFSDALPDIFIDPVRIGQVVLNILLNAIQSITPPGKIEVSTGLKDDYIEIIISDTGMGIPEDKISRIFDPFFTTKEGGTGLGLAVSYGIIKKHGGDIEVRSAVGKGSTFIIKLPVNNKRGKDLT